MHQHGTAAYLFLDDAPESVRRTGEAITATLVDAGTPAIPGFNEVSWSFYPPLTGHITPHRDPHGCGGVIAVVTLTGRATFRIHDGDAAIWETGRGDLVVLAADRWPEAADRCPLHGVDPPPAGERIILTFRHNRNGPGAPYFG